VLYPLGFDGGGGDFDGVAGFGAWGLGVTLLGWLLSRLVPELLPCCLLGQPPDCLFAMIYKF
jgi:hypothetical protein